MLGELMCHLTGFIGLPFEVTFILIGILWFLAGWLISGRRMNNKWSSSVEFLDEELKVKVIKNVSNRRKRTKSPERTKSI